MSIEKIKGWFNEFFEFTTNDRSTVTSVSCKLFAEYVFNKQQERVVELEGKLSNFALQVCDANECEQNSEKQGEILESLLHDALDILGRTDS